MNNLKRILSLALASVMVMGMMVTGASAAKFSDNEDITHNAAVDVMAALGIIKGMDDGSFNPNGDVTRAQMAKMITVALNGKEPNLGKPTTATFADSASHWALEYIEYCANLGIIAGKSATSFDPEGKVTAAEAAKMMLVALGFDAEVFQLVGANWSKNTMTLAQNLRVGKDVENAKVLNLFGGLTGIGANTPLNRDQAAQLIYNGIQSNTVIMAMTGVTSGTLTDILGAASGQTPKYEWSLTGTSLLEDKFGADTVVGVLTKAEYTPATTTSAAFWDYQVTTYDVDGVSKTPASFTFAEDISDSFMQSVRVIYRNEKGSRKTVLAITSAGNGVVETSAWGDLDIDEDNLTVNDYALGAVYTRTGTGASATITETPYDTDTLPVYSVLDPSGDTLENASYKKYDEAKLIDSNGDGLLDCIVVTPITVSTVLTVRPTYIQIQGLGINMALASNDVEEGLVMGDFVTYTQNPETGVYTVKKAETVTGVMAATQDNIAGKRPDRVQVAGSWYTVIENYTTLKGFVGEEVELVLASGYVVNGKKLTEAAATSDAVMVVAKAKNVTTNNTSVDAATTYLEIRVLKADNTTEVLRATSGTSTSINTSDLTVGKLYTYTTNPIAPGCVILKAYDPQTPANQAKYYAATEDATETAITINKGTATQGTTTFRFADDAKVFVLVGDGPAGGEDTTKPHKWAVVSGADVNKWSSQTTDDANSVLYANRTANGFIYVQEGAVILPDRDTIPGATGTTTVYGYVTGAAYYTTSADGRTAYIAVPVWNGTENVTVRAKDLTTDTVIDTTAGSVDQGDEKVFVKGALVSYTDNGDGTVSALTNLPRSLDAIAAWDGVSVLKLANGGAGKELDVNNNTVILYIDGTKGVGVANGNITIADFVDPYAPTKGLYANVYYATLSNDPNAVTGHKEVKVLIVETTNSISRTMVGGNATEVDDWTGDDADAAKAAAVTAIKALPNGAYKGKATNTGLEEVLKGFTDGLGTAVEDVVFFKFGCAGKTDYEITVIKGNDKYEDTMTSDDEATVGIFYFDTANWSAGTYTYKITTGTNVVDTGCFQIAE